MFKTHTKDLTSNNCLCKQRSTYVANAEVIYKALLLVIWKKNLTKEDLQVTFLLK